MESTVRKRRKMSSWCCPVPFLYLYRSGPQPENDTGHSGHNQDNIHGHGQRSVGVSRTSYQVNSTTYHRGLADKRQQCVSWLCFRHPWFLRGKTHLRWNQLLHHILIYFLQALPHPLHLQTFQNQGPLPIFFLQPIQGWASHSEMSHDLMDKLGRSENKWSSIT